VPFPPISAPGRAGDCFLPSGFPAVMPSSGCGDAALVRTFGVEEELLPVHALTVTPAAEGLTGFLRNRSGSRRQRPACGRRGDCSDVVRDAAEATPP
jgi:hypothetical protein